VAFGGDYCDLSLVSQAKSLAEDFLAQEDVTGLIFAGHSLGGTAAFCLAGIFPEGVRSISLNGGAAASNPVISGPGPDRATFYHVFGDLVSTHMSPNAAKVTRIKKPDSTFSVIYPHSSKRALASDGSWKYVSATEEDEAWAKWGEVFNAITGPTIINKVLKFAAFLKGRDFPTKVPIPGSKRWGKYVKNV